MGADDTLGGVCIHHFDFERVSKANNPRHPVVLGICRYCGRRFLLTKEEIKELYAATTLGEAVYRRMDLNFAHTHTKGRGVRPPLASAQAVRNLR